MLQFLRGIGDKTSVALTPDFFRDLNWFSTYLMQFIGKCIMMLSQLKLDACLTGLGGILTIIVTLSPYQRISISTPLYTSKC